jgi:hypothetical protein
MTMDSLCLFPCPKSFSRMLCSQRLLNLNQEVLEKLLRTAMILNVDADILFDQQIVNLLIEFELLINGAEIVDDIP